MLRAFIVSVALLVPSAAFACGGKDCGGTCPMAGHASTPATDASAVAQADGTKVKLSLKGMTCGSCSGKVTAALQAIDGVNAVSVSHETGLAEIAFDAGKTSSEALAKVVTDLGYAATVTQ